LFHHYSFSIEAKVAFYLPGHIFETKTEIVADLNEYKIYFKVLKTYKLEQCAAWCIQNRSAMNK